MKKLVKDLEELLETMDSCDLLEIRCNDKNAKTVILSKHHMYAIRLVLEEMLGELKEELDGKQIG